jgi:hypothetical protein
MGMKMKMEMEKEKKRPELVARMFWDPLLLKERNKESRGNWK